MEVSFCIPAHNEQRLIGATVAALVEAGRSLRLEHEVIVACDACTDGTAESARRAGATAVEIDRRQISAARNAAAGAARGTLLIFVDADTIAPVEAVREAVEAMRAGAVGGGAPARFEGQVPVYARMLLPLVNGMARRMKFAGGCFFFCKREALHEAGGWDEQLFASEEVALARRLGKLGRFAIVQTPVVTSGRKLRHHSAWEIVRLGVRAMVRPSTVRSREHLDLWYGERRGE